MAPKNSTRRVGALLSHVNPAAAEATVATEHSIAEPDDSDYDATVATLATQNSLPVVLLDALLPRQRMRLAVEDDVHKRMVCGCLEAAAAAGTAASFGVVGRDPLSEQPLSFGVEVEIVRSALANGAMQLELVGRRCFSIEGEASTVDGYSVASVGWAYSAEADAAEVEVAEVEEQPEEEERAALQGAVKQLYALTDEWLGLVLATGREQYAGHVGASPPTPSQSLCMRPALTESPRARADEVLLSLGPRPIGGSSPELLAADAAMWAAAVLNPVPALGVAPEIRHVMLAAAVGGIPAMDRIAIVSDAIVESVELMRADATSHSI